MKKMPTLADAIIRRSHHMTQREKDNYDGKYPKRAKDIAEARKFVLNKEASSFLADLSHAAYEDSKAEKIINHLDRIRVLSRLPHPKMWVEYDSQEFRRRTLETYNDSAISITGTGLCHQDGVVPRVGWYLEHMTIEDSSNAPVADYIVVRTCVELPRRDGSGYLPIILPYVFAWTTENYAITDLPSDNLTVSGDGQACDSEIATGVVGYRSTCVRLELAKGVNEDLSVKLAQEFVGELRFIWAFLSTLNDIPISRTRVVPAKGYYAPHGNYKKFVEHEVISINMPKGPDPRVVAKRIVEYSRRRAHQVRGHWRRDWRHPLNSLCDHTFDADMKCQNCGGIKIWIEQHERGDASLGYVLHDYAVTHDDSVTK